MKIGCFLSSEEHGPGALVEQARRAQAAGFHALWISDHYHPWIDEQGHSPFVWSTIGAISPASELPVTTAVTCPTVRIHPAVIAQAAATSALLLQGRFALGVGSGEALNEHILGDAWPDADTRLEMLEEAVEVIRTLWRGGLQDHRGRHDTVSERVHLRPPRPGAADPRLGLRAQGGTRRSAHRRRLRHDHARRRADRALSLRGRQGPGPGRDEGLLRAR
jgi:G6PDH family F420-dependent oxidoreductase